VDLSRHRHQPQRVVVHRANEPQKLRFIGSAKRDGGSRSAPFADTSRTFSLPRGRFFRPTTSQNRPGLCLKSALSFFFVLWVWPKFVRWKVTTDFTARPNRKRRVFHP
jgi:hypothetical protein